MSNFYGNIKTSDFTYNKPVYFTNPFSTDQTDMVVKLTLTSDNFNFSLAKSDGTDFRLIYPNSIAILHMWVPYWSSVRESATLFFKIPYIEAGASVVFQAYWGNDSASSIDSPSEMNLLFYEDFSTTPLSSSKWTGSISAPITEYGYSLTAIINTITNPLSNKNSWVVEMGIYSTANSDIQVDFTGAENDFFIELLTTGVLNHNITQPAGETTETETKNYGGLIGSLNQDIYIDYYGPTDNVTINLTNRSNYPDVTYTIPRKVEGDTRIDNIKLDSYRNLYILWFIVRNWDGAVTSLLDGSELYIEYETISREPLVFTEFGLDFTSETYRHNANFGGVPTRLSNDAYAFDTDAYVSNADATEESYIYMDIHTGLGNDLTSRNYVHYDSGHVLYYNASKLSDDDADRMSRNYWNSTTSSGWAAIKFDVLKSVGAFRIKSHVSTNNRPKNYTFYGSVYNPYLFFDRATEITNGTFSNTSEWQFIKLSEPVSYKYYILDIQDTYGGENIKIQEWEIMPKVDIGRKRYIQQLRLHPSLFENLAYNFPKEISLRGSNNGITWTTILPWTNTYTPFFRHYVGMDYWQLYTFSNIVGYWSFRLLCRGNWGASDGKIIIGEWSMHELATEEYTYRVLAGTSNAVQQIWAIADCGLDDINSTLFIANDKLNKVSYNKLIEYEELPASYEDFNVVV